MKMGKFLKDYGLRLLAVLIGLHLCFIMELGDRSFAAHVIRILKTPEAQELGDEIIVKATSFASGAARRAQLAFSSE